MYFFVFLPGIFLAVWLAIKVSHEDRYHHGQEKPKTEQEQAVAKNDLVS